MKSKKKITLEQAVSFTTYRKESLEREFDEAAKNFTWMMQNGGGIKNIHMLDVIRKMNFLYTQIAAHYDALRSLNVDI